LAFCFISGTVYIINDTCDADADRLHPEKKNRPIASGLVSQQSAFLIAATLGLSAFVLGFFAGAETCFMILIYFVINIAYSFFLKRIPVIDVLIVASGFLLRIIAGGAAAGVPVSNWLYAMVFLLALGIAVGKRYDDLLLIGKGISGSIRPAISGYNLNLTRIALCLIFTAIFITYIFYTCSAELQARLHSTYIFTTAIPALAGIARYLYIALVLKKSGSPVTLMLRDKWLQACVGVWLGLFVWFLYF
jgi:decaprenyl-phosphate phosphoribosyltransferase